MVSQKLSIILKFFQVICGIQESGRFIVAELAQNHHIHFSFLRKCTSSNALFLHSSETCFTPSGLRRVTTATTYTSCQSMLNCKLHTTSYISCITHNNNSDFIHFLPLLFNFGIVVKLILLRPQLNFALSF